MIGLPDIVGGLCFTAIEQIKGETIGLRAVMSQCQQCGVEVLHDPIHRLVGRDRSPMLERYSTHLAVDKGREYICLGKDV